MNDPRSEPPVAVFVANRDFALANSRIPLMLALKEQGWRVTTACSDEGRVDQLTDLGLAHVPVPFVRSQLDRADAVALWRLVRLYSKLRPRLIHHMNAKPILIGSAAAHVCPNAVVINSVTGLGDVRRPGIVGEMISLGYSRASARAAYTMFENGDDRDFFVESGWLDPAKAGVIKSQGVDEGRFTPSEEPSTGRPRVAMVTRLLRTKGVEDFIAVARQLRAAGVDAEFVLGGEWDVEHPESLPQDVVRAAVDEGAIAFVGYVSDMPAFLRSIDLFVFPSYYPEGVPRVLLEAGASGVPVITTTSIGCREGVRDGVTGFAVPPRNVDALSEAVRKLVQDGELRQRMSLAAREWIIENFSVRKVTDEHLRLYSAAGVDLTPSDAGVFADSST